MNSTRRAWEPDALGFTALVTKLRICLAPSCPNSIWACHCLGNSIAQARSRRSCRPSNPAAQWSCARRCVPKLSLGTRTSWRMRGTPNALECGGFPPLSQPDRSANNPSARPAIELFWRSRENPCHEVIGGASASESGEPPQSKALKRSFEGHRSFFRPAIASN